MAEAWTWPLTLTQNHPGNMYTRWINVHRQATRKRDAIGSFSLARDRRSLFLPANFLPRVMALRQAENWLAHQRSAIFSYHRPLSSYFHIRTVRIDFLEATFVENKKKRKKRSEKNKKTIRRNCVLEKFSKFSNNERDSRLRERLHNADNKFVK